jgi:hypothetical protein
MTGSELRTDEKLLHEWRPKFQVFLRKLLAIALVTSALLGAVCFAYSEPLWMLALPLFLVAYLIDDYREWAERRHDRWLLTNQRLMFVNPDEEIETLSIGLDQISRIRKTFWWALSIKMTSGQTISVMFLSPLSEVQTAIKSAQDAFSGGSDG